MINYQSKRNRYETLRKLRKRRRKRRVVKPTLKTTFLIDQKQPRNVVYISLGGATKP
jgi:hypothetical protein